MGKLKMLIAEDDDDSFIYLKTILGKNPIELIRATNGLEALEIVRENTDLSIILMDIKMPEMNGLDVTRQIRTFNADVVIICQTAYALDDDRQKALDAGCTDYISKPINRVKMLELMEKYLGLSYPTLV
jgi:CheY-like chemotaxis protein